MANYGTSNGGTYGSVAEYVGGEQNTGASISYGILFPLAMAIDGLGDIWVENDLTTIDVYAPKFAFETPNAVLQTIQPGLTVNGITIGAGNVVWWSQNNLVVVAASAPALAGNLDQQNPGIPGITLGSRADGGIYAADNSGKVTLIGPSLA